MTSPLDLDLFDRTGARVDLQRWAQLKEDPAYRIVAREQVGDVHVVTAWLGTDQEDGQVTGAPPMIFGTIVQTGPREYDNATEVFAATEEQAMVNHRAQVAALQQGS